jgi:hypothetical protein
VVQEKSEFDDSFMKQVITNQILTRSAPYAGKLSSVMGAALVAESVRRQGVPLLFKYDRFEYNTKSMAIDRGSYNPRTKYATTRLGSAPEYRQEERFWRRRTRAKALYVGTPRVAGGGLIVLGKGLPILAYGYIGYNILTGGDPNPENRRTGSFYGFYVDEHGNTRNEFVELGQYAHEQIQGGIDQQTAMIVGAGGAVKDWAVGAAARALGFAVLQGVLG